MMNPFDPGYYCSEELREFGFAHVGDNVRVAKNCVIIGPANISFGNDVRIDAYTRIIAALGHLNVGDYVHIHTGCMLGCRGGITLGNYTTISHDCRLITASDDIDGNYMVGGVVPDETTRPKVAPIAFKDYSGTAMNVTVLPGVMLSEGSVALLHSVVTRDLDAWTMYAGTPARSIRKRSRGMLGLQVAGDVRVAA